MLQEVIKTKFGFFLAFLNFLVLISSENPVLLNNVPIEFPKNESQYPFVHNSTILRVLASQTKNDTEVDDLLHGGRTAAISPLKHLDISKILSARTDPKANPDEDPKWETELIEDGSNIEDNQFSKNNTNFTPPGHSYGSRLPLVHGEIAAILAIVLVLIVVIGYVGLISWRRYIEIRYGNRQMLVNEEDFYEPSDLRHFSIQ